MKRRTKKNHPFLNWKMGNKGAAVLEIILIIVIIIGLTMIFKTQINELVTEILDNISAAAKKI